MTVTSAPAVTPSSRSSASSRQSLRSYVIFVVCASVYLFPFMRLLLLDTDEGLLVAGAVRVAQGQVFARDFIEIMGPGTFYWLAMFFKLFGVTFLAERICLFVTSLGTGLALYFLSRRISERYQVLPCVIIVGTYFGMVWPTISHHVDSNFFALASVACMVLWNDSHKAWLLFVAGVFAGVTVCIHQPKGVLLFCALEVWLWLRFTRRSSPLSSLGIVFGGYIAPVGLMLIYFWHQHALWDLIYANYVWPSMHYGPMNVVPYGQGIFVQYWKVWAGDGAPPTTLLAAVMIIPFLLIAVLPVLLPILHFVSAKKLPSPCVELYWLCGWAMWLSEIHRKDIQRLVFGSPLLIILCVYYLQENRAKIASMALQVLTISATLLACFNLFLSFAAHPVKTRVGTVAMFKSDPTLAFINEHIPPGQEIFVYPYCPMYYFLFQDTNPTRWSGLGYGYNAPRDFQEVAGVLDQRRVKTVIWDTTIADRQRQFSPLYRPRPDELIIEPYLESHYKVVWEQNGVRIMERISDGPTR